MSERKNAVLSELDKREKILAEYDEKMAKVEELTVELETLKAELAETDVEIIKVEIEEIKDICYKSGLLEKPDEEVAKESEEETPCDKVVEGQPAVATSF